MKTEKDSTKRAMNENKGKIADFLTQLQITDFAKMQTLLSPKYRLDWSFKIQDMMPVAQSVRLVRKFDDIDERKLSNMTFGELIIEFTQVIKENIPEANLTLFLNNINH